MSETGWIEVTGKTRDGRELKGHYRVRAAGRNATMIDVTYADHQKTETLRHGSPNVVAAIIVRELAEEQAHLER